MGLATSCRVEDHIMWSRRVTPQSSRWKSQLSVGLLWPVSFNIGDKRWGWGLLCSKATRPLCLHTSCLGIVLHGFLFIIFCGLYFITKLIKLKCFPTLSSNRSFTCLGGRAARKILLWLPCANAGQKRRQVRHLSAFFHLYCLMAAAKRQKSSQHLFLQETAVGPISIQAVTEAA